MATVTKPMALDESIHTTDGNDTNIADLMQSGLAAIASAVGAIPNPTAANVSWSGTINGTAVTNVSGAITALNDGLTSVNSALTLETTARESIINGYSLTSSSPVNITHKGVTNYGSYFVFGFVQAVGNISLLVFVGNGSVSIIKDLRNFADYSNSNISFSFADGVFTISQTSSAESYITVIG